MQDRRRLVRHAADRPRRRRRASSRRGWRRRTRSAVSAIECCPGQSCARRQRWHVQPAPAVGRDHRGSRKCYGCTVLFHDRRLAHGRTATKDARTHRHGDHRVGVRRDGAARGTARPRNLGRGRRPCAQRRARFRDQLHRHLARLRPQRGAHRPRHRPSPGRILPRLEVRLHRRHATGARPPASRTRTSSRPRTCAPASNRACAA